MPFAVGNTGLQRERKSAEEAELEGRKFFDLFKTTGKFNEIIYSKYNYSIFDATCLIETNFGVQSWYAEYKLRDNEYRYQSQMIPIRKFKDLKRLNNTMYVCIYDLNDRVDFLVTHINNVDINKCQIKEWEGLNNQTENGVNIERKDVLIPYEFFAVYTYNKTTGKFLDKNKYK